MENFYISPDWTFKDIMQYIEALKTQFLGVLASFSCFDIREEVKFIAECKFKIYSLQFEVWKKDKLWEYINDDVELELLESFK